MRWGQGEEPRSGETVTQGPGPTYVGPAPVAPGQPDPEFALLLAALGDRFGKAGLLDHAVQSWQFAVGEFQRLAATDPNGYRRQLTGATNQLAVARQRLADASEPVTGYDAARWEALLEMLDAMVAVFERMAFNGRLEDAAGLAGQAVSMFEQMHEAAPGTGWADLPVVSTMAIAVNNLANMQLETYRYNDAVDLSDEAAWLFQLLDAERPGPYRLAVAMSLANLANGLIGAGRHDDALEPAEQSLAVFEELAASSPERYAVHVERARAMVERLSMLTPAAGLVAVEEAVAHHRDLFTADPQTHRAGYATALLDLAEKAVTTDAVRSLQATEEAIIVCRELSEGPADQRDIRLARASHLHCLGLAGTGRYAEALDAATDAMTRYQRLEAAHPGGFAEAISLVQHNCEVLAARSTAAP